MEQIKVSIIVPVYNIIEYLDECLNSLINQTCNEIEIILVDDGSTDGSGELCDNYTNKYGNIKTIHQENGGLSKARNTGINNALGEYILFVDSDDYINKDTCRFLYDVAEKYNCEIVTYNEIKVKNGIEEKGFTRPVKEYEVYDGTTLLVESIKGHSVSMCAPFALYRKSFITEHGIYFKEGILHEDELWTPQIYLKAKRAIYVNKHFYYHRYREDSITHIKNKERNSKDLINTCYILYDIYSNIEENQRKYLYNYLCMLYLWAVFIGKNYYADKKFALKTASSKKNRLKAILYFISPHVYIMINSYIKKDK